MTVAVEQLFRDALALTPKDRAELANLLRESLEPDHQETDRLCAEEIDRRLMAYQAGDLSTISAEKVLQGFELLRG